MSQLQKPNIAMPIHRITKFFVSWRRYDVETWIATQPEGGSWYPSKMKPAYREADGQRYSATYLTIRILAV
jgi:hypothetical protein